MQSKTWNIDTAHSSIDFSVRHMVFARVRGRFRSWAGTIRLEEEDLTASAVRVQIEGTSIDTGVTERDDHLRSADFLDVERFPKLSYASTRVEKIADGRYRVHGELTIRDVRREVVLEVEYAGLARDPWGNRRAAFAASASIDRKAFGLTWNQVLEAGGVLVGDRIEIELEIQAVEPAASRAA